MKKTYLMAAAIFGGAMSFAQTNNVGPMKKSTSVVNQVRPVTQVQNDDRAFIVWSSDFSVPTDWTLTNTSTPALDFSIVTDPAVIPVADLSPMNSATAANGFLFISSDAVPGNADGDNTPVIVEATTAMQIDCSLEPNVKLRFSHNYRWWQETRQVAVSGDNGVSWTTFDLTDNSGYDIGYGSGLQNSDNPSMESIDISAVAGGSSQVLVKFIYNDNDFWGWYWAIDDVEIIRTEDNDLRFNKDIVGTIGAYGAVLPYYTVPDEQIAPIEFSAMIENIGLVSQTNVTLDVDVNSGASTFSSTASTIMPNTIDSLFTTAYTPAGMGAYDFALSTASADFTDDDPTNNMVANSLITVGDYIYARDNGTQDNGSFNSGQAYEVGNIFDIFVDQACWAINVTVHGNTTDGALVRSILYEVDNATGDFNYITESDDYTVTADDIANGNEVILKFASAQMLTAGKTYLAVIHADGDGGASDDFVTASAGTSADQTSFFQDESATWFFTGRTPMVRLNFDVSLGLDNDNEINASVNAYPNPATDNVNVVYSVTEASNVSVVVTTITGEVVYANNLGTVTAGSHTENINASTMANGVYFYTLTVNGNQITKKLVISKK